MSGSFKSPLKLEYIDGKHWLLIEGFSYHTEIMGIGNIYVPAGFLTDFASIPRGLWNLFPPTGKYGKAAVIHDYLYRWTDVDRKTCDDIFMEGMEVLEVNWFSRRIIYRAVRLFGGAARKQMPPAGSEPI
jgi:hypothetical protein